DLIWSFAGVQARQRLRDDLHWIFAARIVRGEDDIITTRAGGRAHQRTLALIAIATATEESNHAAWLLLRRDEFSSDGGEIAERIVGVGIVHDHSEGLAT